MEEEKKSAGQIIQEFNEKLHDPITPHELITQGSHKNFESSLEACISHYKNLYGKDFYIERRCQHEWPLGGVPRYFMKGRLSCPTPTYLQTVIKYHYKSEAIEHLWTIPSKGQCAIYKSNALIMPDEPEKRKTLLTVLSFEDGSLLRLAKHLNGESDNKLRNIH